MENWDEEKLRNVVLSRHGNPRTTTDVRGDISPFGPVLNVRSDCVQTFYRGHRNSKVRYFELHYSTELIISFQGLDGSGNALMATKSASIGMPCLLDLC